VRSASAAREIDAVLFDMDGTLIDSVGPTLQAYVRTVGECGGGETTAEDVLARFVEGSTPRVLAALLGRPTRDGDLDCFSRHLAEAAESMAPYDGIDAAVSVVADAMPVGVVTGATRRTAQLLLERADLLRYFGVVVGGDEVEAAKPDPASVVLGCRRVGIAPGRVAYVGDAPTDIEAARRAGAISVAAAWGHHYDAEVPADVVARAPGELAGLLL
jgi:HAD superfamily hydrolase (TIGR01509 family)